MRKKQAPQNAVNKKPPQDLQHFADGFKTVALVQEFFNQDISSFDRKVVFPMDMQTVKGMIPDLEEDTGSYISKKLSIGIYAPDGISESILLGNSGYYK